MPAAGVSPEALAFGLQDDLQFGQGREHPVAQAILHLIPESLNRVQFRAVGGQGDHAPVVGQVRIPIPQMKTGPILEEHMERRRIAAAHLPVELAAVD